MVNTGENDVHNLVGGDWNLFSGTILRLDFDRNHSVGNGKSSQLTFTPSFFRGVGGSTTNQNQMKSHNIWDNPSHWRTHIFQDGYTTNQIDVFWILRDVRGRCFLAKKNAPPWSVVLAMSCFTTPRQGSENNQQTGIWLQFLDVVW